MSDHSGRRSPGGQKTGPSPREALCGFGYYARGSRRSVVVVHQRCCDLVMRWGAATMRFRQVWGRRSKLCDPAHRPTAIRRSRSPTSNRDGPRSERDTIVLPHAHSFARRRYIRLRLDGLAGLYAADIGRQRPGAGYCSRLSAGTGWIPSVGFAPSLKRNASRLHCPDAMKRAVVPVEFAVHAEEARCDVPPRGWVRAFPWNLAVVRR